MSTPGEYPDPFFNNRGAPLLSPKALLIPHKSQVKSFVSSSQQFGLDTHTWAPSLISNA